MRDFSLVQEMRYFSSVDLLFSQPIIDNWRYHRPVHWDYVLQQNVTMCDKSLPMSLKWNNLHNIISSCIQFDWAIYYLLTLTTNQSSKFFNNSIQSTVDKMNEYKVIKISKWRKHFDNNKVHLHHKQNN